MSAKSIIKAYSAIFTQQKQHEKLPTEKLYETMLKLAKAPELRMELGKQGRQRVEALFDSRLLIDKHISLYEGMLDKNAE